MKLILSLTLLLYFYNQRVIAGNQTEDHSLRQQASVRRQRKDAYSFGAGHICGGSLISLNVVITAAHCFLDQSKYDGSFSNKSDFYVVLGTRNLYQSTDDSLMFPIKNLLMKMSKFSLNSYSKDIALLVLQGSVCLSDPLSEPIALANSFSSPPTNSSCQLSGWGSPERVFGVDMLFMVNVSLFSDLDCMEQTNISQSGMKCAGFLDEKQPNFCVSDTGGPIICAGQLTGIVSWGIQCGELVLPAVYTDVAYYSEWIKQVINSFPPTTGVKCSGFPPQTPRKSDQLNVQMKNSHSACNKFLRPSLWQVFCIVLQCILNF